MLAERDMNTEIIKLTVAEKISNFVDSLGNASDTVTVKLAEIDDSINRIVDYFVGIVDKKINKASDAIRTSTYNLRIASNRKFKSAYRHDSCSKVERIFNTAHEQTSEGVQNTVHSLNTQFRNTCSGVEGHLDDLQTELVDVRDGVSSTLDQVRNGVVHHLDIPSPDILQQVERLGDALSDPTYECRNITSKYDGSMTSQQIESARHSIVDYPISSESDESYWEECSDNDEGYQQYLRKVRKYVRITSHGNKVLEPVNRKGLPPRPPRDISEGVSYSNKENLASLRRNFKDFSLESRKNEEFSDAEADFSQN